MSVEARQSAEYLKYAHDYLRLFALGEPSVEPPLPCRWDETINSNNFVLSVDGRDVEYLGSSKSKGEAFTVCADLPSGPCHEFYYYEVTWNSGCTEEKLPILILGFEIFLSSNEGDIPQRWMAMRWRSNGMAICFWIGDGRSSAFSIGASFGPGDTIGCGFQRRDRTIFLTKNGKHVATPIPRLTQSEDQIFNIGGYSLLWPSLNIENATGHMKVRANLGQEPFHFNIAAHFGLSQAKTPSNGIHLPPEIVDLVFQHAIQDVPVLHWKLESEGKRLVRYHRYILGRLCLVSRRWSEVFRPLLFHTMLFSEDGDLQQASNILHSRPELSGGIFVRTLWIRPRMLDLSSKEHPTVSLELLAVGQIPHQLPVLHDLIWDAADPAATQGVTQAIPNDVIPPHVAIPALLRAFQSVERLCLRKKSYRSFTRMVLAVAAVPKLASLEMMDVTWPTAESVTPPPAWLKRPQHLRNLDLSCCSIPCAVSCLWMFLLPSRVRTRTRVRDVHPALNLADALVAVELTEFLINAHDITRFYQKASTHFEMHRKEDNSWELDVFVCQGNNRMLLREIFRIHFVIKRPRAKIASASSVHAQIAEVDVSIDFDIALGEITQLQALCGGFEALVCKLSDWETSKIRFGSVDVYAFLQPHETPEYIRGKWAPVSGFMSTLHEAGVLQVMDPPTTMHPRYKPRFGSPIS